MITNDKYIRFVIENYVDIQALLEIIDYTSKTLPDLANREVVDAIFELEISYFKDNGLDISHTKEELWWCDPDIYEAEGVYFGFENTITWANLGESDLLSGIYDQGFPPYLFLYIDLDYVPKKRGKIEHINRWIAILKANRRELRQEDVVLWFDRDEFDYSYPYLAGYSLHKEINMDTIANRSTFRKQIQEATKRFTSALLPILRGTG